MPRGTPGKVKVGLLASESPPAKGHRPSRIVQEMAPVIGLLKEQKGTWFRVAELESPTAANAIRPKMVKAYPNVEFTSRRVNGHSVLYAKWVGK